MTQSRRYPLNGAVVLRGVLSASELADLERAIEWNLANPGPLAGVASADDDPGRFFEDFCNWGRIPAYQRLACHSALPGVAALTHWLFWNRSEFMSSKWQKMLLKKPLMAEHWRWSALIVLYLSYGARQVKV